MNLADAIRQAAHHTGPAPQQAGKPEIEVVENPGWEPTVPATATEPAAPAASSTEEVKMPEPPSQAVNGSVVRLELFLSPEQLSGLFRAVVAAQHTVMTLREAANYVRVTPNILEQMAQEGQVPAMLIDGKWRFPRTGIDEWLSMQTHQKEA